MILTSRFSGLEDEMRGYQCPKFQNNLSRGWGYMTPKKAKVRHKMTHTQQRSTSISMTNHPNPAIRYLIGSSWVGLSNRLCLVSNKKSCGYIQTNQLTQKGKKAAVLKEVDAATQPVGQIWWVRTWIKARKQENPTKHVWRESGRNWEKNGPPKIAKTENVWRESGRNWEKNGPPKIAKTRHS